MSAKAKRTPAVDEGPYYKTGSPERANLVEAGLPGTKLVVTGRVLDDQGRPIPGAWLDFWQADGKGAYDNAGFTLRGHQYADREGRYRLETVRPYEYQVRAAHIHVKVSAGQGAPVFTTQLFFPDERLNPTDPLFEPGTVMNVAAMKDGQTATFDFVIATK
jgi:protocatechuate 3,4-dioxygenase beta subunit